jgi:2-polyprenyl-3-methyl-5-hydroxy-6-metoxy-1,4-benzoquinol methylase
LWGCKDKKDFDQRCKFIELLFDNIKHKGYKSQIEISSLHNIQGSPKIDTNHEVAVCTGRHGDLLFSDGVHRLATAKLLNISNIPVKIVVRHPEWMRLRKELLLYAESMKMDRKIYQPILHPDLNDIPAHHDCEDRFKMIKENMSIKQGCLLDIGANLGYFCHRFEDEGFDCYAIEDSHVNFYFLSKLKRAENKQFKTIKESVLECHKIRDIHFDVVLALYIFHHFIKTKETYYRLIDLLKNLKAEKLFFAPHLPDEAQMQGAYKNYSPEEFVKFIIENSSFKKADFIGVAKDRRPLYKLY